jgi:subtilase family serine protease
VNTIFLPITFFTVFLNWLVPLSVVAQQVQNLEAQITAVEPDPQREEVFKILGTASGREFSSFRLEFGRGEFPESWKSLAQDNRSVSNGLLAEWKTTELASETYAIRLTVKGRSGEGLSDRTIIKLHEIRPDLTVGRVEAKVQGTEVVITGIVENQGRHPVHKPISINFDLSTTPALDSSVVHLGQTRLSFLETKGSVPLEAHFFISPQIKDGNYFLWAKIDPKGELVEANEDNNSAMAPGRILLAPDLVVSELQPTLVKEGHQMVIAGKMKNQGNRPVTKAFVLVLFLSSDGSIDSRDIRMTSQKVEGLTAGSSYAFNLNYSVPETLEPGIYFVLVQIDPEERIFEGDKSNNIYWGNSVTLGPDLAMTALSTTFSKDGKQIVISDSVKNLGRYPVRQPFRVSYFLADRVLGTREVLSLSSGEASSASTSFPMGSIPPGTYGVLARVDAEKTVSDMDRANNELHGNEIQIGSDLAIAKLQITLLANGEQVEVRDTVKNHGTLPVRDPFEVAFYLSTDERLDEADRRLGSRQVNSLDVGAESSGQILVSLPPKTEPGQVFVLAMADPEGVIAETQKGNNTASAGRLLRNDVDLVVSQLTATLISKGDQIVVNNAVKNFGPQDLPGPFSVAFYFSRDGVIDSGDLLLGERRVEGLKAGASSSATFTLAIPEKAGTGKLSVLARVDSRNEVMERKEDNNDYWGSSLPLGPDLIFTDLKGEVTPDAREIVVTFVVKNQGNRIASTGFKVATYLSKDNLIDPGDLPLGSRVIPALDAGGVTTRQTALTFAIPNSLENGKFTLLGRVDPDQGVSEVEEANNDRDGGDVLLGPDLVVEAIKTVLAPEGDRITVEDTVMNRGNRLAPENIEVSYFLSRNWSIDHSDILLGSRAISTLKPGESSTVSTDLLIVKKKVATGRYFVLARVDGGNSMVETDKTNNVRPTLVPLVIRQEKEKR